MTETININYIEIPVTDMGRAKAFYGQAFGWDFIDYGPDYAAFAKAGLEGGLNGSGACKPSKNGALIVLYAKDLTAAVKAVRDAGGEITVPIFAFPGGRRFHFTDICGNELAIWSK
ncbi:MAG TPA: VOC family protein [Hellea balneolensis]|uniref:VOC family protein n=1 Tax=Hellea balneolensis TaxID=287478 RepID=A0A7V5NY73_9PROT|nr:VOC family protein [Hellea balneolensis]